MIHIVATGAANLASVLAAFDRLGHKAVVTTDRAEVGRADRLVLPGVGAFGAAMASLRAMGLDGVLRERVLAGRPTLAVCLGLQLLAESSEESPGVRGLGVLTAAVTRLRSGRVPQMGWNRVAGSRGLVRDGWAYYANSYKLDAAPEGWAASVTDYGTPFIAAVERGGVLACQFHPELSGAWGMDLLRRWARGEHGAVGAVGAVGGANPDLRQRASGPASGTPGATRVIPCLDVRDGRVVKGVKFQNLRDAGDPAQQAAEYERQGADELVMLDVSATPEGRKTAAETVKAIRKVLSIPLTVGGGVRAVEDAGRLLDAGADKVGVNTAAVEEPMLLTELARRFGRQCVVLAIDAARRSGEGADGSAELGAWLSRPAGASEAAATRARRTRTLATPAERWEVVVHSGKTRTGADAVAWARRGAELGAGEILLTSYDRDGTGEGYDPDLLRAACDAVDVPVIASGGARDAAHMAAAVAAGASAVLAASIFHDGIHTVGAVKRELAERGVAVRMEEA